MADPSDDDKRRARLERVAKALQKGVPHNDALGMKFVEFGGGVAVSQLAYDDKLVGNPVTGGLHGGVVTALLDATCGAAVFAEVRAARIATLDLRIDYLRASTPREGLTCRAECYRVTKRVAFVRGIAYHADPDAPVASASGSFMLFRAPPKEAPKTDGGGGSPADDGADKRGAAQ